MKIEIEMSRSDPDSYYVSKDHEPYLSACDGPLKKNYPGESWSTLTGDAVLILSYAPFRNSIRSPVNLAPRIVRNLFWIDDEFDEKAGKTKYYKYQAGDRGTLELSRMYAEAVSQKLSHKPYRVEISYLYWAFEIYED